jgi:hypothetical protein
MLTCEESEHYCIIIILLTSSCCDLRNYCKNAKEGQHRYNTLQVFISYLREEKTGWRVESNSLTGKKEIHERPHCSFAVAKQHRNRIHREADWSIPLQQQQDWSSLQFSACGHIWILLPIWLCGYFHMI